jgi:hypothetical protein
MPDFGATIFPRDEKGAHVVYHLKEQDRVDHGSAMSIRALQEKLMNWRREWKWGCHVENKIVGIDVIASLALHSNFQISTNKGTASRNPQT